MLKLTGNSLIFTDIHFGIRNNSKKRLQICVQIIKEIINACKKYDVKQIFFAGDYFHSRNSLDVYTINVALKCCRSLAKAAKLYIIIGNHDVFSKNTVNISSANIFKDIPNVNIIDMSEVIELNGQRVLLAPWLTDLSKYSPESVDLAIGHFDPPTNYLIKSYIEEHSSNKLKTNEEIKALLEKDSFLTYSNDILIDNSKLEKINSKNSENYIGNIVDPCKKGGIIYSGHIHGHRESNVKGRTLIFIGSPYQTTMGERDKQCGFYVLDSNNARTFIPITDVPKHIEIKISDIIEKGINDFDFSIVRKNIIKKVYDIQIDNVTEAKINQRISDNQPFEELLSDWAIKVTRNDTQISNSSIEAIKRSKLDYIKTYIDNINDKDLEEKHISKDRVYSILKSYYEQIIEEKI